MSKNLKNNPEYLKFFRKDQKQMEKVLKSFQVVNLFLTTNEVIRKTLKSNLTIKPELSFYLIDVKIFDIIVLWKISFPTFLLFFSNFDEKLKLL